MEWQGDGGGRWYFEGGRRHKFPRCYLIERGRAGGKKNEVSTREALETGETEERRTIGTFLREGDERSRRGGEGVEEPFRDRLNGWRVAGLLFSK